MIRAALKSLLDRKVRLLMSTFAIVLGVAFVAGTLIFSDTLNRSFTALFASTVGDVVVRPEGGTTEDGAAGGDQHRVDHQREVAEPLGDEADDVGRAEHARLDRRDREVVQHRLDLRGHDRGRDGVHGSDARRVLGGHRRDDARGVGTEVPDGGHVGREPGGTAAVRAADREHHRRGQHLSSRSSAATSPAGSAARITAPITATPCAPAATAPAARPAAIPPSASTGTTWPA